MPPTPRFQHLYSLGLAGQDGVNRAFGGGLPTGSLAVIEGRHGAGKSTLAGRFAYGLCEQSHTVTYLSTERSFAQFLRRMGSLSYNVRKAMLRRDLLYLFGDLGGGDPDERPELLSRLTAAQQLWTSDVVIIDTFSDLLLYDPTVEKLAESGGQRRAVQRVVSFFRRILATGTTIVLLVSPSGLQEQTLEPLRAVADVLLEISAATDGSRTKRRINVRRFAGMGRRVSDRITFSIRPGSGIVIEDVTVVRR